jgi:hypothetical protein
LNWFCLCRYKPVVKNKRTKRIILPKRKSNKGRKEKFVCGNPDISRIPAFAIVNTLKWRCFRLKDFAATVKYIRSFGW